MNNACLTQFCTIQQCQLFFKDNKNNHILSNIDKLICKIQKLIDQNSDQFYNQDQNSAKKSSC